MKDSLSDLITKGEKPSFNTSSGSGIKPINMDKFGKKKQPEQTNAFIMSRDDTIDFFLSFLRMKVDPVKLSMDAQYYKKAVNVAIANLQVLTRFILEKEGIDVSRITGSKIEIK